MAWVSPATWVTGAIVSAADLNQELRGQFRYLHGDDGTAQVNSGWEVTGTAAYLRTAGITTTQRDALTGSAGMVIYNSTDVRFQGFQGGTWRSLLLASTAAPASGDILWYNGTLLSNLIAGSSGYFLSLSGTAPTWTTPPSQVHINAVAGIGAGTVNTNDVTAAIAYGTSYVKIKETKMNLEGTLRIDFEMEVQVGTGTAFGRIYRNGTAVGTERTVATTAGTYFYFAETISGWSFGDLVQFYGKYTNDESGQGLVRYFRLFGTYAWPFANLVT